MSIRGDKNKYTVRAYLSAGVYHEFPAETIEAAREMASRIVTEGLWVLEAPETFYPVHRVFKVRVICG